jgi:hypothetical protein
MVTAVRFHFSQLPQLVFSHQIFEALNPYALRWRRPIAPSLSAQDIDRKNTLCWLEFLRIMGCHYVYLVRRAQFRI